MTSFEHRLRPSSLLSNCKYAKRACSDDKLKATSEITSAAIVSRVCMSSAASLDVEVSFEAMLAESGLLRKRTTEQCVKRV
jgi:hypothetical protein